MLSLHELKQVLVFVKQFSFVNRNVFLKQILLWQPLQWCCVDCVIHHERDVREEQHHTYMWREQTIIE